MFSSKHTCAGGLWTWLRQAGHDVFVVVGSADSTVPKLSAFLQFSSWFSTPNISHFQQSSSFPLAHKSTARGLFLCGPQCSSSFLSLTNRGRLLTMFPGCIVSIIFKRGCWGNCTVCFAHASPWRERWWVHRKPSMTWNRGHYSFTTQMRLGWQNESGVSLETDAVCPVCEPWWKSSDLCPCLFLASPQQKEVRVSYQGRCKSVWW